MTDSTKITDFPTPLGLVTNRVGNPVPRRTNKRTGLYKKTKDALEAGDAQGVIDSLTPLQVRFIEEYLQTMCAKSAVIAAGYKTKHPYKMGSQLMENPAIRFAIDALKVERGMFSDVTKDYVLKKIVKTLEAAEGQSNHTAVLRAAELLAKHLGMFIDRTEISGPDGQAIEIQKKTKEEADSFLELIDRTAKRA